MLIWCFSGLAGFLVSGFLVVMLFAFTWVEGAWCLALDLLMGVGCCLVLSVF